MTTKYKECGACYPGTDGYGYGGGLTAISIEGPPLSPLVEVIPYAYVNNKILFLFQKKEGLQKIKIAKEFKEEYKASFEAQHSTTAAETLQKDELYFGCTTISGLSADRCPVKEYVIYKTSGQRPLSFFDFGAQYDTVDRDDGAYIDEIQPNKKYFYIFRAISVGKEQKSYPDLVYSVELIDEGGVIFPSIEILDFSKGRDHKKSIIFNKRLKVKPAFLQAAPNPQKTIQKYAGGQPVASMPGDLGYEDKSTFINKDDPRSERYPKFKFRIISNSSQKKVDINIFMRKMVEFKSVSEAYDFKYVKNKDGSSKFTSKKPTEEMKEERRKKLQGQLLTGLWEKIISWDDDGL